jgi:hypothetical protein
MGLFFMLLFFSFSFSFVNKLIFHVMHYGYACASYTLLSDHLERFLIILWIGQPMTTRSELEGEVYTEKLFP